MFNLGYVNLQWRAYAEAIYWAANYKIHRLARESSYVPDELEGLEKSLADIYQEILGDLHNLFGDNNVVQIALDGGNHAYNIEHVEYGDSVSEVLVYVQQSKDELISQFRQSVEQAVRTGKCTLEEARHILETYRAGFEGYTYLER